MMNYKPGGYNSVSPYLMVKDGNKFAEMLKHIFGATEKRKYLREDGTIMHAEILIDDTVIMFSEATEAYPSVPMWLHVYVPNVHETFKKAMEFGCEKLDEPVQKNGDEDCRGNFKDADGINWSVSTQM